MLALRPGKGKGGKPWRKEIYCRAWRRSLPRKFVYFFLRLGRSFFLRFLGAALVAPARAPGMGYVGAHNLNDLFENTTFCEISPAGLRESHVHDVVITKEAPNYRIEN